MEIKRIVYYSHPEALDGFYPDMEDQYATDEGAVITKEERLLHHDGKPFPYTVYIVKELESKKIKAIEAKYIKEYIID